MSANDINEPPDLIPENGIEAQNETVPAPSSDNIGERFDYDDNWSRLDEATTVGIANDDSMRIESVNELQSLRHDGNISFAAAENMNLNQLSLGSSVSGDGGRRTNDVPQPPVKPELSMKEKLVLRERQRRIETERARLKRQFALSGTSDANNFDNDDQSDSSSTDQGGGQRFSVNHSIDGGGGGDMHSIGRDGSIAEGTLGEESTRAHPDHESPAHDESTRLGFNMERFLRNSDSFNPRLEPMVETMEVLNNLPDQGVVMERFLNDPIVVPPLVLNENTEGEDRSIANERARLGNDITNEGISSIGAGVTGLESQRSVSFDIAGPSVEPISSFGYDVGANASLASNASVHGEAGEIESLTAVDDIPDNSMLSTLIYRQVIPSNNIDGNVLDEPRVLRLTEADMQEMAAIEVASLGNAPPSEREEEILSEIGELADFSGGNHGMGNDHTAVSQDTTTTAMESASQISDGIGYQSTRISLNVHNRPASLSSVLAAEDDESTERRSVENLPMPSISSQLILSPGAISNQSVAVNPPSVMAGDDEDVTDILMNDDDVHRDIEMDGAVAHMRRDPASIPYSIPEFTVVENFERLNGLSEVNGNGNRIRNPGYRNSPQLSDNQAAQSSSLTMGLLPLFNQPSRPVIVEGFDFEKDSNLNSNDKEHNYDDSFMASADDHIWREGSDNAQIPTNPMYRNALNSAAPGANNIVSGSNNHYDYGSIVNDSHSLKIESNKNSKNTYFSNHEDSPLLAEEQPSEVLGDVNESRGKSDNTRRGSSTSRRFPSLVSWDSASRRFSFQPEAVFESVFHEVKSFNEVEDVEQFNESEQYLNSSTFQRGMYDRLSLSITNYFDFLSPILSSIS